MQLRIKNLSVLMLLISTICESQTVLAPLDGSSNNAQPGTYFKDLEGDMDPFVGTWRYEYSGVIFTIQLQKKEALYQDGYYYDLLAGEYSYSEPQNNISINTLPLLNDNLASGFDHNISGNRFAYPNVYHCSDCGPTEKRFKLHFRDPERPYLTTYVLIIRHLAQIPEKLHVELKITHGLMIDEGLPTEIRIPLGEYLMEKIE